MKKMTFFGLLFVLLLPLVMSCSKSEGTELIYQKSRYYIFYCKSKADVQAVCEQEFDDFDSMSKEEISEFWKDFWKSCDEISMDSDLEEDLYYEFNEEILEPMLKEKFYKYTDGYYLKYHRGSSMERSSGGVDYLFNLSFVKQPTENTTNYLNCKKSWLTDEL